MSSAAYPVMSNMPGWAIADVCVGMDMDCKYMGSATICSLACLARSWDSARSRFAASVPVKIASATEDEFSRERSALTILDTMVVLLCQEVELSGWTTVMFIAGVSAVFSPSVERVRKVCREALAEPDADA